MIHWPNEDLLYLLELYLLHHLDYSQVPKKRYKRQGANSSRRMLCFPKFFLTYRGTCIRACSFPPNFPAEI